MEATREVVISTAVKFAGIFLALVTACSAQDGLHIKNRGNQKWPAAEAQTIYLSACSTVQREFGRRLSFAPNVTLVLGADKNEVWFTGREIRLDKWNRDAFAQGVVWLAAMDLMPAEVDHSEARRDLGPYSVSGAT